MPMGKASRTYNIYAKKGIQRCSVHKGMERTTERKIPMQPAAFKNLESRHSFDFNGYQSILMGRLGFHNQHEALDMLD
jgi:hypothetical protein